MPFLLRGFLRLLVLVTPLFVFFAVLDSDNRRTTWVDTNTTFSAELSPSTTLGGDPRPLLSSVSAHAIVARVLPIQAPGIVARWDVVGATISWLVVALLVLAVAEAFDVGVRMADVDGLV